MYDPQKVLGLHALTSGLPPPVSEGCIAQVERRFRDTGLAVRLLRQADESAVSRGARS